MSTGAAVAATAVLAGLAVGLGARTLLDRSTGHATGWPGAGGHGSGARRRAAGFSGIHGPVSDSALHRWERFLGLAIDRAGMRHRLEHALDATGVAYSPERWLGAGAAVWLAGSLLAVSFGSWMALMAVPVLTLSGMLWYLRRARLRRTRLIRKQLPFFFDALAGSVGAGRSMRQAIQESADTCSEPLKSLVQAASVDLALGTPVSTVLEQLGRVLSLPEALPALHGLSLQHALGGDEKKMLISAAKMLRLEATLTESLRAKTAQARMSVNLVSVAPLALLALLALTMPDYLSVFTQTTEGQALFATAVALDVLGVLAVRRILRIEGAR